MNRFPQLTQLDNTACGASYRTSLPAAGAARRTAGRFGALPAAAVVQVGFRVQEISEYLRLVEIYGRGCIRLVRILKSKENLQDGAERRVREAMHIAARQVLEEKRLEALS